MGKMRYGDHEIRFDDRTLAHLQVVIANKLRRQECFFMSWQTPVEQGSGRVSVWLHPSIPLMFTYQRGGRTPINREWVEALLKSAHSATGLIVLPEPPRESATNGEPVDVPQSHNRLRAV